MEFSRSTFALTETKEWKARQREKRLKGRLGSHYVCPVDGVNTGVGNLLIGLRSILDNTGAYCLGAEYGFRQVCHAL